MKERSVVHLQKFDVDVVRRAKLKGQSPCVIWFTGLSGAGKSTLANLTESKLVAAGRHTYVLDGDNLRHGLTADLGFSDADRAENVRRIAEVAKLMVDAGLIVLCALISPLQSDRAIARGLFRKGEFIEVFVDAPLAEVERRDPKGLYKRARRGEISNFTGIDSPYDAPKNAEIHIETSLTSAEEGVASVLKLVLEMQC